MEIDADVEANSRDNEIDNEHRSKDISLCMKFKKKSKCRHSAVWSVGHGNQLFFVFNIHSIILNYCINGTSSNRRECILKTKRMKKINAHASWKRLEYIFNKNNLKQ